MFSLNSWPHHHWANVACTIRSCNTGKSTDIDTKANKKTLLTSLKAQVKQNAVLKPSSEQPCVTSVCGLRTEKVHGPYHEPCYICLIMPHSDITPGTLFDDRLECRKPLTPFTSREMRRRCSQYRLQLYIRNLTRGTK